MLQRLTYLLRIWLRTMLLFIVAKLVFMLCYACSESFAVTDVFAVVWHGLSLDFSTSLYILALPFLLTIAAVWTKVSSIVLGAYYALIAVALALAFVADTSLYAFWRFKLDASCLSYLSTPTEAMASVSTAYLLLRLLLVVVLAVAIFFGYTAWTGKLHFRGSKVPRVLETAIYIMAIPLFVIGIRGGICEKYTCPMLVVDSLVPPRMPMTIRGIRHTYRAVSIIRWRSGKPWPAGQNLGIRAA